MYSNFWQIIKFSLIFLLTYFKSIFAQDPPQEIPLQTQPLQGTGIQRVGSAPVPIPTKSLELMAMPSISLPKPPNIAIPQQQSSMSSKRLPYDTTYMAGRVVYLNGVNISSVKNQDLEDVNIRIDKNGNIYIDAPHYEVGVEQSYHPLMPSELPKFPKADLRESSFPKGIYSKETGKIVNQQNATSPPVVPKQFAPEVPVTEQAPMQIPSQQQNNSQNTNVQNQAQESTQSKVQPQQEQSTSVGKQGQQNNNVPNQIKN